MSRRLWSILLAILAGLLSAPVICVSADSPPTITVSKIAGDTAPQVNWEVGADATLATAQVYVSVDDGPETLFAEASRGSKPAPWIAPTSTYRFRLYAGTDHTTVLAETAVAPEVGRSMANSSSSPGMAASASVSWTPPDIRVVLATPRVQSIVVTFAVLVLTILACVVTAIIAPSARAWTLRVATLAAIVWALLPVLAAQPRPLTQQPFPDSSEYADGALQLAEGHGYVTVVHGNGPEPPRYPPGMSSALAPFALFGDFPDNVERGAQAYSALFVVAAAALAWRMGGALAALLTALAIGSSPFASVSSSLVLSDALAAALTLPLAWLVRRRGLRAGLAAGTLVGALTTIRLSAGLALPALLVAGSGRFRRGAVIGIAPVLAFLAVYQWQTFGSPLRTGYDYWLPGVKNFDLMYVTTMPPFGDGPWILPDALGGTLLGWVCPCGLGGPQASMPNLTFYPAVLLGLFWVFTPPLVGLYGLAVAWRARDEPTGRFTLAYVAVSTSLMMLYFYQGTRFMAAAATLLLVEATTGSAYVLQGLVKGAREFALARRRTYASSRYLIYSGRKGAKAKGSINDLEQS